jgi:hypothetical protein
MPQIAPIPHLREPAFVDRRQAWTLIELEEHAPARTRRALMAVEEKDDRPRSCLVWLKLEEFGSAGEHDPLLLGQGGLCCDKGQ